MTDPVGAAGLPPAASMPVLPRARSMLFMPGGSAEMIAKIARFAPDTAVVDLEDAVSQRDKDAARGIAGKAIDDLDASGATTVLMRVNPPGTPWFEDDLAAAAASAASGIVVPKLHSTEQLRQVHDQLARHSWVSAVVVAGIEDALGVADVRLLVGSGVSAVYFGAEDFIADLCGRRTERGDEVLYARSRVCLAAHLAGISAVDQAVVTLGEDERFQRDAEAGVALGYRGKICIHPRQVELAHQAFTPTPEELTHARAVVAAADEGVGVVDGQMVDDVHVRMARGVIGQAPDEVGRS